MPYRRPDRLFLAVFTVAVTDHGAGIPSELLTYMMEDPRNITGCTHLLFIAKNIERMGDHATNIAKIVHYQVKGAQLPDDRPRGGDPSFTVVDIETPTNEDRTPLL
jgi:phosphate transport system protein